MTVSYTCPACKRTMTIGSPTYLDEDGKLTTKPDGPSAGDGDVTVCAACGAVLKHRAGNWVEMSAEDLLALPDSERITLNRISRVMERRRTNPLGLAAHGDDCSCGSKEEHDKNMRMMVRAMLIDPTKKAMENIKKSTEVEPSISLHTLAEVCLGELAKRIPKNADPIKENQLDMSLLMTAILVLRSDGTLANALAKGEEHLATIDREAKL